MNANRKLCNKIEPFALFDSQVLFYSHLDVRVAFGREYDCFAEF